MPGPRQPEQTMIMKVVKLVRDYLTKFASRRVRVQGLWEVEKDGARDGKHENLRLDLGTLRTIPCGVLEGLIALAVFENQGLHNRLGSGQRPHVGDAV